MARVTFGPSDKMVCAWAFVLLWSGVTQGVALMTFIALASVNMQTTLEPLYKGHSKLRTLLL